ncbi:GNAT family N-acetyltransferase [Flagellimonas sp.]|uniref:GNAT family N-acetyltransferase n=1 Tax=Flagellimonas sp. TaxID=2058762 RepID=UPI003F49F402
MSNYLLDGQYTARLLFRKIVPSDFDAWLPFHEEPLSSQFWEGLPSDPKVACQEQFERIFERYEHNLGGMNALILKENNKMVGLCGLLVQSVDNTEELEIGYSILPQYWRQGLAFEAAQQCKMHAFSNNLTKSLISIIHVDNIPSQKVAIKNGMKLDKTTSYRDNPVHIFRVNQP